MTGQVSREVHEDHVEKPQCGRDFAHRDDVQARQTHPMSLIQAILHTGRHHYWRNFLNTSIEDRYAYHHPLFRGYSRIRRYLVNV